MRPFLYRSFCFSFFFLFYFSFVSSFTISFCGMKERRKLSSERHHLIVEIIEALLMEI